MPHRGTVRDISKEETMTQDITLAEASALGRRRGGGEELVETVPVDTALVAAGPSSRRNQRGMVSAEWAVGIIAAVAIAGVLLGIVTSGPIHDALLEFILMVIRSFSDFIK
jgi:CBS domain-containing protein